MAVSCTYAFQIRLKCKSIAKRVCKTLLFWNCLPTVSKCKPRSLPAVCSKCGANFQVRNLSVDAFLELKDDHSVFVKI